MIKLPDGRCVVRPTELDLELDCDLYVNVDEEDEATRARCAERGFIVNRRESRYLVPTDPAVTGLDETTCPASLAFARADDVDLSRLRLLDDALRQDVSGTDGWRWDEAGFRAEIESPSFDPATYLVAVVRGTGDYVGIVRVWNNPGQPRLGFIGVLPKHRRQGVARTLLARAFGVLHVRGMGEVSTEIDDTNVASKSLLVSLGARRTGAVLELMRRARP